MSDSREGENKTYGTAARDAPVSRADFERAIRHLNMDALTCTVHAQRPRVCRSYDCREDPRIWIDFAARIPQPTDQPVPHAREAGFDLVERARQRARAATVEKKAIGTSFADAGPVVGPKPPGSL